MAPATSSALLGEVSKVTGLNQTKSKVLAGKLLGGVDSIANTVHEPASKALRSAVPELDEWKKLAETDDKLAEPEPSARPTPGTDLASKALAATGLGEVVDISQVTSLLKQLGVEDNPEKKATDVSAKFAEFLKGIMPEDMFGMVVDAIPWLEGKDSANIKDGGKSTVSAIRTKVEETAASAGGAVDNVVQGAAAAAEQGDKKKKGVISGLKDGIKKMFKKSPKKDKGHTEDAEHFENVETESTEEAPTKDTSQGLPKHEEPAVAAGAAIS